MLEKIYKWKALNSSGLLVEPEDSGPYYDRESLNGYEGGYDSEDKAVDALNNWRDTKRFIYDDFVLVVIYQKRIK